MVCLCHDVRARVSVWVSLFGCRLCVCVRPCVLVLVIYCVRVSGCVCLSRSLCLSLRVCATRLVRVFWKGGVCFVCVCVRACTTIWMCFCVHVDVCECLLFCSFSTEPLRKLQGLYLLIILKVFERPTRNSGFLPSVDRLCFRKYRIKRDVRRGCTKNQKLRAGKIKSSVQEK